MSYLMRWLICCYTFLRDSKVNYFSTTVCSSLVSGGEKQDEESVSGRKRMELLQSLCAMNPKEALFIRSLCVS